MEDDLSTDSDDNEPFDFMALDLDETRVDPGDDNIFADVQYCQAKGVSRNQEADDDALDVGGDDDYDGDDNEVGIALRRSPENACLPRKIDPHRCRSPPMSLVQRIQNKIRPPEKTDPASVPLAIPGLHRSPGAELATDSRGRHPGELSARERFRNFSRQIKQNRLMARGNQHKQELTPKIYLLNPNGGEYFLEKSSLSGLAKKRHLEDDISDDDISAFDKHKTGPSGQTHKHRGRIERLFAPILGCLRSFLSGVTDCVWRCFGGEKEFEETFSNINEPRLEFSSLLEADNFENSQPIQRKDVRTVRQTAV